MKRAAAFASFYALTACGGASHSAPVSFAASASAGSYAAAEFTITVPASGQQSFTRRPQYVSAGTQSVVVTLTQVNGTPFSGAGASTAVNLSVSNPACSEAPLTCRFTVSAPVGNDTFTVATYDAPQSSASPASPAGDLLSAGTLAMTVTAGPNNAALVLNGVPASISLTPAGPAGSNAGTNYLQGNVAGLRLWGPQAQMVALNAVDAAGQTIIGSGAPALGLASSSAALSVSGTGNTYTIQASTSGSPPVVTPGTAMLTASAGGMSVSIPVTIAHSAVYVCTGSTGTSVLAFYDGNAIPSLTIATGLNGPRGVAVDASGMMYVANHGNNTLTEYPAGQTSPSITIAGLSFPEGVGIDPSGNMWVANSGSGQVAEYPPGQTSPTTTIGTGLPAIRGVSFDRTGNLWVTDQPSGVAEEFDAPLSGASSVAVTVSGLNMPIGVANDASGNLWLVNAGATTAAVYLAPVTGSSTAAVTLGAANGLNGPVGDAVDAAGTLWIANGGNNTVTRCLAPLGSVACTAALSATGALWVAAVPGAVVP